MEQEYTQLVKLLEEIKEALEHSQRELNAMHAENKKLFDATATLLKACATVKVISKKHKLSPLPPEISTAIINTSIAYDTVLDNLITDNAVSLSLQQNQ